MWHKQTFVPATHPWFGIQSKIGTFFFRNISQQTCYSMIFRMFSIPWLFCSEIFFIKLPMNIDLSIIGIPVKDKSLRTLKRPKIQNRFLHFMIKEKSYEIMTLPMIALAVAFTCQTALVFPLFLTSLLQELPYWNWSSIIGYWINNFVVSHFYIP